MLHLVQLLGVAASHGLLTGQIIFSTAFVGACELPNWNHAPRQVNACRWRSQVARAWARDGWQDAMTGPGYGKCEPYQMSLTALDQLLVDSHVEDLIEMLDQILHVREDVSHAFAVSHRLRHSRPMQRTLKQLRSDPQAEALIRSRTLMPSFRLEQLLALPGGSLGYTFGRLIQALGYDPSFHPGPEYFNNLEADADYVNYRTFATHDLHHVLTGFNFDSSGELGVLGVSMGQHAAPGLTFIGLAFLLASWLETDVPYSMVSQDRDRIRSARYKFSLIQQGLEIGEAARPLFALDWPSLLDHDLEELRRELGVEPVREGLASWYSRTELVAALS